MRDISNGRLFERSFSGVTIPEVLRRGEFQHHEAVDAGYLTLDRPVGRFNVQAGMRLEHVATRFQLPLEDESFGTSYMDLFPNLNVSRDLGAGQQIRVSYARRLNRPPPFMLDPTDRSSDPLNRFVGNPYLAPGYTQSLNADASWTGGFGTLRLSPYFRGSVDFWDQISTLDVSGVATRSWFNVASVRTAGVSSSASVRQFGPLSGSVNLNGYRDQREASYGGQDYSGSSFRLSAGTNLSVRASDDLSFGLSGNYNPPRDTPQGTMGAMIFTNMNVRRQFLERRASVSLAVADPLGLTQFRMTTRDPTLVESESGRPSFRRASLNVSYSFGRPPQSARRQSGPPEEAPQAPTPGVGP